FYKFNHSNINIRCTYGHFQLRNLLWAPNKNNIYYIYDDIVKRWSPHLKTTQDVMNVQQSQTAQGMTFKISSMACRHNMMVVGGFTGEFACQRMDNKDTPVYYGLITYHVNGIANHIDIISSRSGSTCAIVSSNDHKVRTINLETLKPDSVLNFPFPINCSATTLNGQLMCAVGDTTRTLIIDIVSNKVVADINEHHDYSFACAWHPNGWMLATGNQDKTTRIYDIRKSTKAVYVLGANIGSIRSLQFSHNGKYLAASEPIDFVHLYDTSTYDQSQVIDMFGDISGICK
ncbi:WD40-repeat-containing domain protein, partial [Spinellus fusiger]